VQKWIEEQINDSSFVRTEQNCKLSSSIEFLEMAPGQKKYFRMLGLGRSLLWVTKIHLKKANFLACQDKKISFMVRSKKYPGDTQVIYRGPGKGPIYQLIFGCPTLLSSTLLYKKKVFLFSCYFSNFEYFLHPLPLALFC